MSLGPTCPGCAFAVSGCECGPDEVAVFTIPEMGCAKAEAESRGYAAAVADVVADLGIQVRGLKLMGKPSLARYARGLAKRFSDGDHVGAAKAASPKEAREP